ncbi:MAG: hypothetical protein LWW86_10985 [Micrococcales bacterium]|nr:hypothetical protein [Micrococcales bacterium]
MPLLAAQLSFPAGLLWWGGLEVSLSSDRATVGQQVWAGVEMSDADGRTAVLERRTGRAWTEFSRATIDDGRARLAAPTTAYASDMELRVRVLGGDEEVSDPLHLRVDPPYEPVGRPEMARPGTARWNPCAPIRYAVDEGAPVGAAEDVRAALAEVSRATGLTFVEAGTTGVVPQNDTASLGAGVDLVVAWADPDATSMLDPIEGGVVPMAGGTAAEVPGYRGEDGRPTGWIVQGRVVINERYDLVPGFGAPTQSTGLPRRGTVLLHELAHAVGVGHADDATQLMNSGEAPAPHDLERYGAGDLAALEAVGAGRGCVLDTRGAQVGTWPGNG